MNVYQNVNVTGDATVSGKVTAQTLEADALGVNAQAAVKALISAMYPVGAYYWSGAPTDPGSFIGGTWEQITGKFLLASDDVLENGVIKTAGTYHVGATGGSANAVVVSHGHEVKTSDGGNHPNSYVGFSGGSTAGVSPYSSFSYESGNWGESTQIQAVTTGVDGTGKNMPPYVVGYLWKRIA
nr:MAG TPA: baseplate protein [Caudoviricetes sp.]